MKNRNTTMKREHEIAVAECTDHDETFGPTHADDVSYWVMENHRECDVNMVNWSEAEVVQCADCTSEATHLEERPTMTGAVTQVPYCNDCGNYEAEE